MDGSDHAGRTTDDTHGAGPTRRQVALGAAAAPMLVGASPAARPQVTAGTGDTESAFTARMLVNGTPRELALDPRSSLLDVLRERLGLTGAKKGCDHGQCGACTVHLDGRRVASCLTMAVQADGREVATIEGLSPPDGDLHPMQQAFIDHDGFQCGYCTSGQIMSAAAVVREPWGPTDDDVREAMSGNICRCGAYPGIVAAIQQVRKGTSTDSTGGRR
jgi:xanthine dehydrogenase YagT iron-sulfur-binding subunit